MHNCKAHTHLKYILWGAKLLGSEAWLNRMWFTLVKQNTACTCSFPHGLKQQQPHRSECVETFLNLTLNLRYAEEHLQLSHSKCNFLHQSTTPFHNFLLLPYEANVLSQQICPLSIVSSLALKQTKSSLRLMWLWRAFTNTTQTHKATINQFTISEK